MAKRPVRAATPPAPPAHIDTHSSSPPDADLIGLAPSRAPIDSTALYTIDEAAVPLRLGASTLRRLLGNGTIPRRFTTKIGGKLFMTGAQISGAIEYCGQADAPTGMVRPHRRRRREVA